MSLLKASTYIITNFPTLPIGLAEILAIMSVSTFKIAVILYLLVSVTSDTWHYRSRQYPPSFDNRTISVVLCKYGAHFGSKSISPCCFLTTPSPLHCKGIHYLPSFWEMLGCSMCGSLGSVTRTQCLKGNLAWMFLSST